LRRFPIRALLDHLVVLVVEVVCLGSARISPTKSSAWVVARFDSLDGAAGYPLHVRIRLPGGEGLKSFAPMLTVTLSDRAARAVRSAATDAVIERSAAELEKLAQS